LFKINKFCSNKYFIMHTSKEKEQLGSNLLDYIVKIETLIFSKLKNQLKAPNDVPNQVYIISEVERLDSMDIGLTEIKIHKLFSPEGYELSGNAKLDVMVWTNENTQHSLKIRVDFESAKVWFDYNSETFELANGINITGIVKSSY